MADPARPCVGCQQSIPAWSRADGWLVALRYLVRQLWRARPEDPDQTGPLVDLLVRKAKPLPAREVERVRRWSRRHDPGYDWARDRFLIWGNVVVEDLFDRLAPEDPQPGGMAGSGQPKEEADLTGCASRPRPAATARRRRDNDLGVPYAAKTSS